MSQRSASGVTNFYPSLGAWRGPQVVNAPQSRTKFDPDSRDGLNGRRVHQDQATEELRRVPASLKNKCPLARGPRHQPFWRSGLFGPFVAVGFALLVTHAVAGANPPAQYAKGSDRRLPRPCLRSSLGSTCGPWRGLQRSVWIERCAPKNSASSGGFTLVGRRYSDASAH